MAIDIKNLLEFAQRDISTIDSTSNTQTVLDLFRLANRAGPTLHMYDSTSDLPNLVDATADTAQIAYVKSKKELYFNDGSWKPQTTTGPQPSPSYSFQGSNYGYFAGGWNPGGYYNTIEKYSYTSDGNATDVGDLTEGKRYTAGASSSDNGYSAGGDKGATITNVIEKFPFATDTNASDVADLLAVTYGGAGQSTSSYGYKSGGWLPGASNVIQKFPFSTDANSTDVGDLTVGRYMVTGQSSSENGYSSGGAAPALSNVIDKFPFASDANATDVGNLFNTSYRAAGQSSTTHGYHSGGQISPSSYATAVEKISFASDGDTAGSVLTLTAGRALVNGTSSTASGYAAGGWTPGQSNVIDKFPFASDTNATDVGDLTLARAHGSVGQQY